MPIILGIFSQPIVYPLQQLAGMVDGFPTEFDLLTGERPMAILRLQALPYRLFKLPLVSSSFRSMKRTPKYGLSEDQRQPPPGFLKTASGLPPRRFGRGLWLWRGPRAPLSARAAPCRTRRSPPTGLRIPPRRLPNCSVLWVIADWLIASPLLRGQLRKILLQQYRPLASMVTASASLAVGEPRVSVSA
jgi:hypothetical protein